MYYGTPLEHKAAAWTQRPGGCHDDVEILLVQIIDLGADETAQVRHILGYGIGCKTRHHDATEDVEMGIVGLTLGAELVLPCRNPHEEILGEGRAHLLDQLVCELVHVDEYGTRLLGHVAGRVEIGSVGIDKDETSLGVLCGAYRRIVIAVLRLDACACGEIAAHDGVHQDRYATLRTRVIDILAQYLVKCPAGHSIAVLVLDFLVVMSELDYHIVSGADLLHNGIPAALADEAL